MSNECSGENNTNSIVYEPSTEKLKIDDSSGVISTFGYVKKNIFTGEPDTASAKNYLIKNTNDGYENIAKLIGNTNRIYDSFSPSNITIQNYYKFYSEQFQNVSPFVFKFDGDVIQELVEDGVNEQAKVNSLIKTDEFYSEPIEFGDPGNPIVEPIEIRNSLSTNPIQLSIPISASAIPDYCEILQKSNEFLNGIFGETGVIDDSNCSKINIELVSNENQSCKTNSIIRNNLSYPLIMNDEIKNANRRLFNEFIHSILEGGQSEYEDFLFTSNGLRYSLFASGFIVELLARFASGYSDYFEIGLVKEQTRFAQYNDHGKSTNLQMNPYSPSQRMMIYGLAYLPDSGDEWKNKISISNVPMVSDDYRIDLLSDKPSFAYTDYDSTTYCTREGCPDSVMDCKKLEVPFTLKFMPGFIYEDEKGRVYGGIENWNYVMNEINTQISGELIHCPTKEGEWINDIYHDEEKDDYLDLPNGNIYRFIDGQKKEIHFYPYYQINKSDIDDLLMKVLTRTIIDSGEIKNTVWFGAVNYENSSIFESKFYPQISYHDSSPLLHWFNTEYIVSRTANGGIEHRTASENEEIAKASGCPYSFDSTIPITSRYVSSEYWERVWLNEDRTIAPEHETSNIDQNLTPQQIIQKYGLTPIQISEYIVKAEELDSSDLNNACEYGTYAEDREYEYVSPCNSPWHVIKGTINLHFQTPADSTKNQLFDGFCPYTTSQDCYLINDYSLENWINILHKQEVVDSILEYFKEMIERNPKIIQLYNLWKMKKEVFENNFN